MDQPKIERLLRLMKMLAGSINYTVDEIADKLQMSRRTVYRYIDTLKGAGFVIHRIGDSFRMMKESRHFDDIEQLVHFSEEESYLVNRLIDGLDDTNMLKQNLRKKLATVYNVTAMADCVVRKEHVANTHELIAAIEDKRQVILHNYSSSNKGDVRDRIVEPFAFTTNYIQVWCYEPQSKMNKLFRISRIGAVEQTDTPWEHQEEHRSEKTDIFRTSGNTPIRIKIELGTMAKNLLLEEFPLAERHLTHTKSDRWILDTEVYRLEGVGRFTIGVANDIKIIEGDSLRSYLQEFIAQHCEKMLQ
jgi:predicted DNA-binding transcriptional regulator YafY